MDQKELIQAIASGIRRMNYPPDFLLFIDTYSDVYTDLSQICNIPIIRCGYMNTSSQMDTIKCPFVPCYNHINDSHVLNSSYFYRGYEDRL